MSVQVKQDKVYEETGKKHVTAERGFSSVLEYVYLCFSSDEQEQCRGGELACVIAMGSTAVAVQPRRPTGLLPCTVKCDFFS